MRYMSVIEKCENNYSAYFPDVPGCVATGKDEKEVLKNLESALLFHIEGLQEQNLSLPAPNSFSSYIAV